MNWRRSANYNFVKRWKQHLSSQIHTPPAITIPNLQGNLRNRYIGALSGCRSHCMCVCSCGGSQRRRGCSLLQTENSKRLLFSPGKLTRDILFAKSWTLSKSVFNACWRMRNVRTNAATSHYFILFFFHCWGATM